MLLYKKIIYGLVYPSKKIETFEQVVYFLIEWLVSGNEPS